MQNLTTIRKVAVKKEFLSAHGAVRTGQLGFDPLHEAMSMENVHARGLTDFEILREFLKADAADVIILIFGCVLTHHRFA